MYKNPNFPSKCSIQRALFLMAPYALTFYTNLPCGTMPNAFWKSRNIPSTALPLSTTDVQASRVSNKFVGQLLSAVNPCWWLVNRLWFSMCFIMCPLWRLKLGKVHWLKTLDDSYLHQSYYLYWKFVKLPFSSLTVKHAHWLIYWTVCTKTLLILLSIPSAFVKRYLNLCFARGFNFLNLFSIYWTLNSMSLSVLSLEIFLLDSRTKF